MASETYDLKGILFLAFAITIVASTNIDCSGKAFYCINATHFMICVDLGGGVSTTIDDFVIPCPPTTECHEYNIFECDFPKTVVTTPRLEVIGDEQSDLSVTTPVIDSVPVPTLPDKSSIVLNENTTPTTVPIPEEMTFGKKLDILESLKQPTQDTMETSANENFNDNKTNNNTIRNTSATDKSIILDSVVQTTTDNAVIAADKFKSIDTVTMMPSTLKINELICNNSQSLVETSSIPNTTTTLADLLISKRAMKNTEVNETFTDEMNNTTSMVNNISNVLGGISKTETDNQNNSFNKMFSEHNPTLFISEIYTTEKAVLNDNKTNNNTIRNTSATDKNIILDSVVQTTTDNAVIAADKFQSIDTLTMMPSTLKNNELIYNNSQSLVETSSIPNTTTTLADLLISKQAMKNTEVNKTFTDEMNNTTSMVNTYISNVLGGISKTETDNQNNSFNKVISEYNQTLFVSEIYTTEEAVSNDNNTNNNTIRNTSASDKNTILDSVVQTSADNTVIAADKFKSIDTVPMAATTLKDSELIYNDSKSSVGTNSISNTTTTLADFLISKRAMKNTEVNDTFTNEMKTSSTVKTYISNGSDSISKTDNGNQNNSFNKMFSEDNPTLFISEIYTEKAVLDKRNSTIETLKEVLIDQTTVKKNHDSVLDDKVAKPRKSSKILSVFNTSDNISTTVAQYTTTQATINGETTITISSLQSDILSEISTTTVANENIHKVKKDNVKVHQNIVEYIPIAEVIRPVHPETITKYIFHDKIENSILAPEASVNSYQTTIDSILENSIYSTTATLNDYSLAEDVTDPNSRKVTTKTRFTDNSYQMNRESTNRFIATINNASGFNEIISTIQYNTSSTNMLNNITSELNTFQTIATIYPSTEIPNPQNEAITNATEVENNVPSAIPSFNKTLSNIYTTPIPYNTTFSLIGNNTVKDWISHKDNFANASTDVVDIIYRNTSDDHSFLDHSITDDAFSTNHGSRNLSNISTTITTVNNLTPPPTHVFYANELTTNIPEIIYTTSTMDWEHVDFLPKVTRQHSQISNKIIPATDYKVETSTRWSIDVTQYTNTEKKEQSLENISMTTPARESIIKVDTTELINANSASTERFTDRFTSSITTISAINMDSTSNWKDSDNIETTTSTVVENKVANNSENIQPNNIKNVDITTFPSINTNKDESLQIMPLMESNNSFMNSQKEILLKQSIMSLSNSTKYNDSNVSVPDDYIGTTKLESSSFYTTLLNWNPGNKFTPVIKTAFNQSGNLKINMETTESWPQLNLQLSIASTQTSQIKGKDTETSTDPPSRSLGFEQRNLTTNSMNYMTEKLMDHATPKVISTKLSNLSNVTNATNSMSGLVIDKINKTTVAIPSTTYSVRPRGIKNNSLEGKGLSAVDALIETQTDAYDNKKSILKPESEPTRKNSMVSRATSAPVTVTYSNITKTEISNLPLSLISPANYNVSQSIIRNPAETIKTDSSVVNTVIEGTGKKILETDANGDSFGEVINNQTILYTNFDDKSAKNIIDNENILFGNNAFQGNIQNTTIVTKYHAVDTNEENINYTENNVIKMDSPKKKEFNINDYPYKELVTPGTTVSKSTNITVTINPLYSIKTGSANPKYSTPLKTIEGHTTNLLNNISLSNRDSETISTVINNSKANLNASYSNLTQQNNIVYGSLEKNLKSTNHTINIEIQGHCNNSDKQTSELKSNGETMWNSSANILDSDSKYNVINNDSASVFNCLNHTRGKYADKKDCRKFYICVGKLQPITGTCPNNTVFSEINKQCTRNLSHCVRNNQFRCLLEGRFTDFFQDNVYYICIKNSMNSFMRYKLQCQNGYHINKVSVKCERNEDISSQSASSAGENYKIGYDESKPKSKIETKQINTTTVFECNSEGKFPYEKDCRKYYVCTNVNNIYRRKVKKCGSDEVFDNIKKKCTENESIEC